MLNKSLILALLSLMLLYSCKGRKNRQKKTDGLVSVIRDSAAAETTADGLIGPSIRPWTYFSSRIDVEFRYGDNKKINPSASIRMYKDSLIWISGGLFGIEGFRILINKDSMVLLNKIERSYTVYRNSALAGISDAPLTVTQIQNLLLGKPVFALRFYDILSQNNDRLHIQYRQEKFNTQHSFQKQYFTIDSTVIRDLNGPSYAEAIYGSYAVVNDHNFPFYTFISALNGQNTYGVELRYSDADFVSELSFPFTIPASYEKTK